MTSLRVPSISTEYVKTQVTFKLEGAVGDPTLFPVHWAFTEPGIEPDTGDWILGSWETTTVGTKYFARVLIGPGTSAVLTDGQYDAWVKVTGVPEIPVKSVGRLVIT